MSPAVRIAPGGRRKLELLARAAQHDLSCACGSEPSRTRGLDGRWIYPVALPSGGRAPLLKVLQIGGCERNCAYCAQRLGGGALEDVSFTPEELAGAFLGMHRAGRAFGLFLSSAIRGGAVRTMDRMLATAELLRARHRYRGYLHLKLVPGCRPDQVERAMELATRVSVNMEAPSAAHLAQVAPAKRWNEQIVAPMRQVARAVEERRFRRGGQTTQFVVGAAGESDRELGRTTHWLYRELRLARVYYSALQPLAGTPLEGRAPTSFQREHRLYQMDFLLRQYGFELDEIPFEASGQLPLDTDPKTRWAHLHPERFPVELNTAPRELLVRVPGIGPRSARRVIDMRRQGRIVDLDTLARAGADARVAARWLLLDGKPAERPGRQLSLF